MLWIWIIWLKKQWFKYYRSYILNLNDKCLIKDNYKLLSTLQNSFGSETILMNLIEHLLKKIEKMINNFGYPQ